MAGFLMLDNEVMETLGVECAVVLACICEKLLYNTKQNTLSAGGYCYVTTPTITKRTKLSWHKQKKAIDKLIKYGLIEIELRGMPAKRYFKLADYSILNFKKQVSKKLRNKDLNFSETSISKIEKHASENFRSMYPKNLEQTNTTYNTTNNTTTTKNTESSKVVIQKYMDSFGCPNPILLDQIINDANLYSADWCLHAIDIALLNNKRRWPYVQGILKNWYAANPIDSKPWENERMKQNGTNKHNCRRIDDIDWSVETGEFSTS